MTVICPTITAYDLEAYRAQMNQVAPFAKRIHIDLMDGKLAPTKSPELRDIWWPYELTADIHLMYQHPMEALHQLLHMRPHMVIIHAEASVHHMHFAAELHKHHIKAGLALLQDTSVASVEKMLHSFDQILIFSGNLGHHGGTANLHLLGKVHEVRQQYPEVEIAWDGGVSDQNVRPLSLAGINVLNAGGYVQKSADPAVAYATLNTIVEGN
jgi:ribulose-phosphate 3-epimerase